VWDAAPNCKEPSAGAPNCKEASAGAPHTHLPGAPAGAYLWGAGGDALRASTMQDVWEDVYRNKPIFS
jgi:hypothetical protein